MQNRIHFLSGLPRTGSTLLGSILNQNPFVFCSPTSALYPLLFDTNETLNRLAIQHTFDVGTVGNHIYRSIVNAFYQQSRPRPIVFDKHRGWPRSIAAIQSLVDPFPRIVATVRPIAEIVTSYIVLAHDDPSNFIDAHLNRDGIPVTDESRAKLLWTHYLKQPYESLRIGLDSHPENILLVAYDRLCYDPQSVLDDVYRFCGIEPHRHEFDHIKNTCEEAKDDAWGLKNLHVIRSRVSKQSVNPLAVLPPEAIRYFQQFDIHVGATWQT